MKPMVARIMNKIHQNPPNMIPKRIHTTTRGRKHPIISAKTTPKKLKNHISYFLLYFMFFNLKLDYHGFLKKSRTYDISFCARINL